MNMNQWQDIGYSLEAKLRENSTILVRNQRQKSEYPHLILEIDDRGNIINVRPSDSRASLGSVEGTFFIVNLVKEKLLQTTLLLQSTENLDRAR